MKYIKMVSNIKMIRSFSKTKQLKYLTRLVFIRSLNVTANWAVFLFSPIWIAPAMMFGILKNRDFVNNFIAGKEGYFK